MTTEEFELWLRLQQCFCVRRAIKSELTEDEIYTLLTKEFLTEKSIQGSLQTFRRFKSGELKIPDWVFENLRKAAEGFEDEWEDE